MSKRKKKQRWRKRARARAVSRKQPRKPRAIRPEAAMLGEEAVAEKPFEYEVPKGEWSLGGIRYHSRDQLAWWRRHEPPIRAWLDELETADDPYVRSAQHAAFCLAHYASRDMSWELRERDEIYTWSDFDTDEFLFRDLSEGGTVGMCGPVGVFFDHLVEAMRRWTTTGLVPDELGPRFIAEMQAAREGFISRYGHERDGSSASM